MLKELDYWKTFGTINRALLIAKYKLEDRVKELRESKDETNHVLADMEQKALDDINFIRENDITTQIMKACRLGFVEVKQNPAGTGSSSEEK